MRKWSIILQKILLNTKITERPTFVPSYKCKENVDCHPRNVFINIITSNIAEMDSMYFLNLYYLHSWVDGIVVQLENA